MFIAALLQGPGFSIPVKVRNMSMSGALVEAPTVPATGSEARLVRGSLAMPCTVAWSAEGRCGLRFSALACVRDWLSPPANEGQQRVDEVVSLLKLGAVPLPPRSASDSDSLSEAKLAILGADLHRVARLIQNLGDELAADARVLETHAGALQNVDIGVQTLAVIADAMAGPADDQAVATRLESLRASCMQALKAETSA
jgi:hypothetical protein